MRAGLSSSAWLVLLSACGGASVPPSATAWAGAGAAAPVASVDSETGATIAAAPAPASPAPVASPAPRPPPPSPPAAPPGDLYTYRGTVGGKRVVVRMTCSATCSGYYFFEDRGEALRLRQVDPKTFESVTGLRDRTAVQGTLAFDAPPGKASWRGRFSASDASASPRAAPVTLARVVANGHPSFVRRTLVDRSGTDERCAVKVESFELLGLKDATLEWRINQGLAPESIARAHLQAEEPAADERDGFDDSLGGAHIHCRIAVQQGGCYIEATAKVVMLDDRLLSAAFRSDDAAGEAHPDYAVAGATVDLATGEVLDARELLADPAREPPWATLLTPTQDLAAATAGRTVAIEYATGGVTSRSYAWSPWPWKSFYLTAQGVALPPRVDEFEKALRDHVQTVPYAKVKGALRADGPAAYLWAGRRTRR